MKTLHRLFALLVFLQAGWLAGQTGGPYDLSWSRIAGGGVTFEAGSTYSLGATTGQQDAGTISGGTLTLNGGFWAGAAVGCGAATPAITAPSFVAVGATGVTASATNVAGATYAWVLTGGTITSGQGTHQIGFSAGPAGTTMSLSVTDSVGSCVSPPGATRVQVDFLDVPPSDPFHDYVDTLARDGVTAGCGGGNYCRNGNVTRAQMAVFLLKGQHGSSYVPPPCTGVFPDVECTPTPAFAVDWIEQLHAEGVTGGCGGGDYCPANPVTRAQMAVFLLKAEHGSSYVPPSCTGIFLDVECTPVPAFAVDWIERLFAEGVTGGCGGGNYCPANPVTRGQMAVFLVKTFQLP
ncbi:MAG TPA: S-layer homology domain-containing protein [Thermoanaerobaculia bacterium]|jgi:hypothetical protein|nr:S-layer homology domain-containing protein [Thermoanaerobaculia bacterium]